MIDNIECQKYPIVNFQCYNNFFFFQIFLDQKFCFGKNLGLIFRFLPNDLNFEIAKCFTLNIGQNSLSNRE